MKKTLLTTLVGLALWGANSLATADDYCTFDPCQNQWASCDGKFTVGADWLYWKLEQSNMDVAALVDVGTLDSSVLVHAKKLHLNHKYNNGFRVYAGYALPCNGWDLTVSYFNLPGHAKTSETISTDSELISFLDNASISITDPDLTLSSLGQKWDSNLQNVDVDLARTICFGECFKLRPHVGVRVTWMDQKFRFAGIFLPSEDLPAGVTNVLAGKFSEKFTGVGVEGGIWANWEIGAGFGVVGHVGGSMLYTKFRINWDDNISTLGVDGPDTPLILVDFTSGTYCLGTPSLDYFLGLKYTSYFCETELSAYVGWEQRVLFDVNQLGTQSGNLYTQGLTAGLAVAF